MPMTMSHIIEILITLSEDDDTELASKSKEIVMKFSQGYFPNTLKIMTENIEENFYNLLSAMPRIFNSLGNHLLSKTHLNDFQ